ncbi:hypothetical protein HN51_049027 [Arachis hypogaea]|uniref:lysine-specific demethylase JMJ28 n=1 Tax=Arachis hypogaea TaxID=3818 RepID=UPI000DED254F|nr:lysine-specific demethylase JMJ25 [Arachis hypogaea]QHO25723.1 Lysine-specific demethylase [Arachis hypogaea]
MGKKSAAATGEEEYVPPDNLRCGRTDGRQWRCRRRVKDNLKLCEVHYLQGRHRQYKEKVPEFLKLQRNKRKSHSHSPSPPSSPANNVEIRARKDSKIALLAKKKRKLSDGTSEALVVQKKNKNKKRKNKNKGLRSGDDKHLELIRMVLTREVEKRKKRNKKNDDDEEDEECSEGAELRRELPNGVMAISTASTANGFNGNVGSHFDVKLAADSNSKALAVTPRYFRSKNVDRVPVGRLQVVQYGQGLKKKGKGKKKRCHWCQKSNSQNLIKCSSCNKEFFCMDCIKQRYFGTENEVKKACPVCRGTCTCKDCLASQYKDSESKEHSAGKSRVGRILHLHYLLCMLLPVLKQISEYQDTQLETEARIKGMEASDIHIRQVEFGFNEKKFCNHCKTPILDLNRSCPSCLYSLCLNCFQELSQGSISGESMLKLPIKTKTCAAREKENADEKAISSCNITHCNGIDTVSFPSTELGGCGNSHRDLRYIFPSSLIKEMELKAEEIVCSYEFPEIPDKSSKCSMCSDTDHKTKRHKQLQEAALRGDSNDNCLFNPTVSDINGDNFEHFQKHWGKGHPVVVQDVLRKTSNLSWDPLIMFCSYLERSITRYESDKDLLESCLDWCEVEINIRQSFSGSLKCRPCENTCHEMLKLKGLLSSQLFKEQFPGHFSEVIDALPIQEYMNPMSGLLNLAASLPLQSTKHDIGPYVHISFGCADKEADSVTKLCYDSYDVVNIMAHTTDVPLSTEQLSKIQRLLKKHKALCRRDSSKITAEQQQEEKVKETLPPHAEEVEQKGSQRVAKEVDFLRRVNRTSFVSTHTEKATTGSIENSFSQDRECDLSDSDSEPTVLHGLSTGRNPRNLFESSKDKNKFSAEHSGAQWDVFRRQDVPKLMEYLIRHCDEFSHNYDNDKVMVHPILDQSIFLDKNHKIRLKEEFQVEPWTFKQHVGEAVVIPAGCPYQIRNPKCCVHVVLEFVSPENVSECIQLIDEVRLLPADHKAKVETLQVKKMVLHSMNTAIKEMHELTNKPAKT